MTRFKSLVQNKPVNATESPGQVLSWPASYPGNGLANLSPDDWSLNVSGAIEKQTRFIFRNILALPQTTQDRRWICADGWSIKANWQGVLLEEIVRRVHPQTIESETLWVHQTNLRGEKECLRLDELLQGHAILCHKVNDTPLPWLYGGPVALMVFDRYGYKGLGQINELVFSNEPVNESAHAQKGYPLDGAIAPGDYYAFDLQAFRPLHGPELYTP